MVGEGPGGHEGNAEMRKIKLYHEPTERDEVCEVLRADGEENLAGRLEVTRGDELAVREEEAAALRLAEVTVAFRKPGTPVVFLDERS